MDNLMHAIEMGMAVFLFVFGLTYASISYTRIRDYSETLIFINSQNRRGGTASDRLLEEADTNRKVSRAEVMMAIVNLPDTDHSVIVSNLTFQKTNSGYLMTREGMSSTYNSRNELIAWLSENLKDMDYTVTYSHDVIRYQ